MLSILKEKIENNFREKPFSFKMYTGTVEEGNFVLEYNFVLIKCILVFFKNYWYENKMSGKFFFVSSVSLTPFALILSFIYM